MLTRNKKRKFLGWTLMLVGTVGTSYIGGYKLALCPLINILDCAVDKTLNYKIFILSIIKMIFAIPTAYLLFLIAFSIAAYFLVD